MFANWPKLVLATDSLTKLRKTAWPQFVWPKMVTPGARETPLSPHPEGWWGRDGWLPNPERSGPKGGGPNLGEVENFARTFSFGTLVEYIQITVKDKSRAHQFGKKTLKGILLVYVLRAGGGWSRDLMMADNEDVQESEASEINVK